MLWVGQRRACTDNRATGDADACSSSQRFVAQPPRGLPPPPPQNPPKLLQRTPEALFLFAGGFGGGQPPGKAEQQT
eukprot:2820499-Alexandrium_andersonii.AAC.1